MDKEMGWNLDNSYARLPEKFFQELKLNAVSSPSLVVFNESLASELGLDREKLKGQEGIEIFAGNRLPEGSFPIAQAYAGHQFGNFTMLGDGRALLLGEHMTPSEKRIDVQLKGAGRTLYSRGGDGRAALGPMLREYIISESMHSLGIPTTRSLAVVTTGESVIREEKLAGAILTRTALSHLRVGTFEYAAQWGSIEERRSLLDYAIQRHDPELDKSEHRTLHFFEEVSKRQAALIAKWQLVGFIHGVMNTDNMTISGETIDFGPCAFMDEYDPETVFSSIDLRGRYAYQNQPAIGQWNLARLAETLLPFIHNDQEQAVKLAEDVLVWYGKWYHEYWLNGMRQKLGIYNKEKEDKDFIEDLLHLMKEHRADFTNTFRYLTLGLPEKTSMYGTKEFTEWHVRWQQRLSRQKETKASMYELMKQSNPAIIPRNHRVEEALQAAVEEGDKQVMNELLDALSDPYAYTSEQEKYTDVPEASNRVYRTFCGT